MMDSPCTSASKPFDMSRGRRWVSVTVLRYQQLCDKGFLRGNFEVSRLLLRRF